MDPRTPRRSTRKKKKSTPAHRYTGKLVAKVKNGRVIFGEVSNKETDFNGHSIYAVEWKLRSKAGRAQQLNEDEIQEAMTLYQDHQENHCSIAITPMGRNSSTTAKENQRDAFASQEKHVPVVDSPDPKKCHNILADVTNDIQGNHCSIAITPMGRNSSTTAKENQKDAFASQEKHVLVVDSPDPKKSHDILADVTNGIHTPVMPESEDLLAGAPWTASPYDTEKEEQNVKLPETHKEDLKLTIPTISLFDLCLLEDYDATGNNKEDNNESDLQELRAKTEQKEKEIKQKEKENEGLKLQVAVFMGGVDMLTKEKAIEKQKQWDLEKSLKEKEEEVRSLQTKLGQVQQENELMVKGFMAPN